MEKNELSRNAHGGTELMLQRLHETLDQDLLSKFQIIPSRVREIDKNKIPILWLHDLPNDPESARLNNPEYRKQFGKIIMVSNWQMQMYNLIHNIPYSECMVINNAIYPFEAHHKPDVHEQINLIYHTTPHRGLALLVPVFERLLEFHDNIHLDVYSSFNAYGWPERDKPYEELFHKCKNHPNITYHGFQPNDVIREALKKSHIFAYPCIWPETSCIAAIEAMSSANIIVAPNYAGLTDTCNRWMASYQWAENPSEHASRFLGVLSDAITNIRADPTTYSNYINAQKGYADTFYNWNSVSQIWQQTLKDML